jgi:hypothetical protein
MKWHRASSSIEFEIPYVGGEKMIVSGGETDRQVTLVMDLDQPL